MENKQRRPVMMIDEAIRDLLSRKQELLKHPKYRWNPKYSVEVKVIEAEIVKRLKELESKAYRAAENLKAQMEKDRGPVQS